MQFNKENAGGFFILGTLILVQFSCAPLPYDYYKPSSDSGNYVKWDSNLVGPSDAIALENKGYELKVKYDGDIKLQLFVPYGSRIYLKDPRLIVYWGGKTTMYTAYKSDFDNYGFSSNSNEFVGRKRGNILQRNGTNYFTRINTDKWPDTLEIKLPLFEMPNGYVVRFNNVLFIRKWGLAVTPIN